MTPGTVADLEAVMQEIRRLRKMNAPHVRERERRRKENNHRIKTASNLPLLKLAMLPYRLSKKSEALLKCENAAKEALKQRSPEEWAERIMFLSVTKAARKVVANLCWWDYFATRGVSERWPHLDKFLTGETPYCDTALVARTLESLGYTPWQAKQRSEGGSEMEDETENAVDGDDEDGLDTEDATRCEQAGFPDRSPCRTPTRSGC